MLKLLRKSMVTFISVVLVLLTLTATCFANDGLPVLQYEHKSYIGTAGSSVTVGAYVVSPDDSSPMKGVKVTFKVKDSKGTETALPTQTSGEDGLVTCEVALGENFPYTLIGSASDGVNLSEVKIKSDTKKTEKKETKKAKTETKKETKKSDTPSEEKTALDNLSALVIILIGVVVLATIIIIVVVKKNNKKHYGKH